jgi:hypothetical protein
LQPIVDCKDAVRKFGNEESRGIYLLVKIGKDLTEIRLKGTLSKTS